MARNNRSQKRTPKPTPAPTPARRGGWKHPLAAVLLVVAIAWLVGTIFATTDNNFPSVGEIPVLFDIGRWNYLIAAVVAFVAMTTADRTRPEPPPGEPHAAGNRWAGPAMVTSAIIGLVWIVVFYVISGTDATIPVYSDLGQWNIIIGMGFIIAAFGFAMKWE